MTRATIAVFFLTGALLLIFLGQIRLPAAGAEDGAGIPGPLDPASVELTPAAMEVIARAVHRSEEAGIDWHTASETAAGALRVSEVLRDVNHRIETVRSTKQDEVDTIVAEGALTLMLDLAYVQRVPDGVADTQRRQLESLYTHMDGELDRVFEEYDASESVREKVRSHYDAIKSQAFSFVDDPRIASMSKIRTEEQMASLVLEVSRVGIETAREFRQAMGGMFLDGHEPGSREHEKGLTHLLRDSAEFLASRPFQLYATSSFGDVESLNDLPEVTGMRIAYMSGSPSGFFLVRYLNE